MKVRKLTRVLQTALALSLVLSIGQASVAAEDMETMTLTTYRTLNLTQTDASNPTTEVQVYITAPKEELEKLDSPSAWAKTLAAPNPSEVAELLAAISQQDPVTGKILEENQSSLKIFTYDLQLLRKNPFIWEASPRRSYENWKKLNLSFSHAFTPEAGMKTIAVTYAMTHGRMTDEANFSRATLLPNTIVGNRVYAGYDESGPVGVIFLNVPVKDEAKPAGVDKKDGEKKEEPGESGKDESKKEESKEEKQGSEGEQKSADASKKDKVPATGAAAGAASLVILAAAALAARKER